MALCYCAEVFGVPQAAQRRWCTVQEVSLGGGVMTKLPSFLLRTVRPGLWIQTDGGQRVALWWWNPWPVLTTEYC